MNNFISKVLAAAIFIMVISFTTVAIVATAVVVSAMFVYLKCNLVASICIVALLVVGLAINSVMRISKKDAHSEA